MRFRVFAAVALAASLAGCAGREAYTPPALRPLPGAAADAPLPPVGRGAFRPTLAQVLRLLDDRNPELLALRRSLDAAGHAARQADRGPNPSVTVGPRFPLQDPYTPEGSAGVSQKIEIGKRGPRVREGAAQATQAAAELEARRVALALDAKELCFDFLAAEEAAALEAEDLDLLEALAALAEARVAAGAESRHRLLAARVAAGKSALALRERHRAIEALARRLDALLDLEPGTVAGVNGRLDAFPNLPAAEALRAAVREQNPGVLLAAARVTTAAARLEREEAVAVPDLTVGVSYARSTEMGGSGGKNALGLSLGFPVPLWDANRAAAEAARARVRAAEEGVRQARQKGLEALEGLLAAWQTAAADAAAWEGELLPTLALSKTLARAAADAGRASAEEPLLASRELVAGRRIVLELRREGARARARLEALAGGALP